MSAADLRRMVVTLLFTFGFFSGLRPAQSASFASPEHPVQGRRGGRAQQSVPSAPARTAQPSQSGGGAILPPDVVARIPRSVNDMAGHPDGVVNVVIVGPENNLKLTIGTAEWQAVDRSAQDPVQLRASEQALEPEPYVGSALSELFLMGRPQDYGFVHDDPNAAVKTRHSLRIWRAPFQVGGAMAWIGAAVHDVPWWDEKDAVVSDKPDPDVDSERDFVGDTLNSTGLVERFGYVQLSRPAPDADTSIGDYKTDGRILVLFTLNLPGQ